MIEKKDLFCAPSLYSLFLYTLINDEWTQSDYVLARIPPIILERLKNLYGVSVYDYPVRFDKNPIKKIFLRNLDLINYLREFKNKKYDIVWGNDEFPASFPYRLNGIRLIEDGTFNSCSKKETVKRQRHNDMLYLNYWFYWIFKGYVSYGWSKKVNCIYHTPEIKLPKEIDPKGIQINLKEKWQSLPNVRRNEILNLFGLSEVFVNQINEYSTVLVTQALPIPDDDKIAIYKRMTEGMDMSKVLIKTHYAEKTDYSKVFPESTIVSLPVPMQLFGLIGYHPTKVMTISSGAVGAFIKDGVEVVFLGTEVDPRISDKFGIITKESFINNLKKGNK